MGRVVAGAVVAAVLAGGAAPAHAAAQAPAAQVLAAQQGSVETLRAFLDRGGDPDAADAQGATLLHHAVASGQDEVVGLLLARRADVNAARSNGVTPLHVAVAYRRRAIVERLVAAGADAGAADSQGRTPLALAQTKQDSALIGLCRAAAARGTADEARALARLNADRAAQGLPALQRDERLAGLARAHAADMASRDYFDHKTPEGLSPFDRMRAAGLAYRCAGENIARTASVQNAQAMWMKSPGHRANILQKEYSHVGLGAVRDRKGRVYVVQLFARLAVVPAGPTPAAAAAPVQVADLPQGETLVPAGEELGARVAW